MRQGFAEFSEERIVKFAATHVMLALAKRPVWLLLLLVTSAAAVSAAGSMIIITGSAITPIQSGHWVTYKTNYCIRSSDSFLLRLLFLILYSKKEKKKKKLPLKVIVVFVGFVRPE